MPRLAIVSRSVWAVVKCHEGRYLRVNNCNHITATTTVTAVGSTQWSELFTHDRGATMATITALGVDCCVINECCHQFTSLSVREMKKSGPSGPAFLAKTMYGELRSKDNVDNSAATGSSELNDTLAQCKKGVVLASSHVVAGVKVGSALTDNYFPSVDFLSAETLHAEALRVTVASVPGAGCTFLMCHGSLPCRNVGDLNRGQLRAMALTTTVTDLIFVLQNVNFDSAMMIKDLSGHLDLGECC
jgi:hypothetical protein